MDSERLVTGLVNALVSRPDDFSNSNEQLLEWFDNKTYQHWFMNTTESSLLILRHPFNHTFTQIESDAVRPFWRKMIENKKKQWMADAVDKLERINSGISR